MSLASDAIDVNFSLGVWPFAPVEVSSAQDLIAQLDRQQVDQAWVGSFDGIFHRDVAGVNQRLAQQCREAPDRLLPFGSINPMLPDWQEDVRCCHEQHAMRGVRVHPAAHGYALDRMEFGQLLADASRRGLVVQLVVSLEDERTQHPVLRIPHVELTPLEKLVRGEPSLRLVVLSAFRSLRFDEAARLAAASQVWFDIAMLEGVDRVAALVDAIGPERVLLGSHWPLFHQQAAQLKLRESSLPESVQQRVRRDNALSVLSVAGS